MENTSNVKQGQMMHRNVFIIGAFHLVTQVDKYRSVFVIY